jgi:hypothetical protein
VCKENEGEVFKTENIAGILWVLFISSWRSGWEQHGSKCAKLKAGAENIFPKESNIIGERNKNHNVVKPYRTITFALYICVYIWSGWSLKMYVCPQIWDRFALLAAGKLDFLVVDLKYSSQN